MITINKKIREGYNVKVTTNLQNVPNFLGSDALYFTLCERGATIEVEVFMENQNLDLSKEPDYAMLFLDHNGMIVDVNFQDINLHCGVFMTHDITHIDIDKWDMLDREIQQILLGTDVSDGMEAKIIRTMSLMEGVDPEAHSIEAQSSNEDFFDMILILSAAAIAKGGGDHV